MFWMDGLPDTDVAGASAVGSQNFTGASSTPASLGAVVGDLAVVLSALAGVHSGSGGAWNSAAISDGNLTLYWRILTSADLTAAITNSSRPGALSIYRGATSLAQRTTSFTDTVASFAPATNHAGLIGVTRCLNDDNGANFVLPATWRKLGSLPFNSDRGELYDRLSPPSFTYNGETFAVSRSAPAATAYSAVFELLS